MNSINTERIFCCFSMFLIKTRCFIFLCVSINKRQNPLLLHTESFIEIYIEVKKNRLNVEFSSLEVDDQMSRFQSLDFFITFSCRYSL